jgi:hypothetical protein
VTGPDGAGGDPQDGQSDETAPDEPSDGTVPDGEPVEGWPAPIRGVTESIVATLGPNDLYNHAALGLHAGEPITATTWGNTRTRRNFDRQTEVYVQFSPDPVDFVAAALSIHETDGPILERSPAWSRVTVEKIDREEREGTICRTWRLDPIEGGVRQRTVPVTNRGYGAVVEATVAASRLDVDTYDTAALHERLDYFAGIVERCGGLAERRAIGLLSDHVDWSNPER